MKFFKLRLTSYDHLWLSRKFENEIICFKALISTNANNAVKNTKIELISLGQLISKGLYHVK